MEKREIFLIWSILKMDTDDSNDRDYLEAEKERNNNKLKN